MPLAIFPASCYNVHTATRAFHGAPRCGAVWPSGWCWTAFLCNSYTHPARIAAVTSWFYCAYRTKTAARLSCAAAVGIVGLYAPFMLAIKTLYSRLRLVCRPVSMPYTRYQTHKRITGPHIARQPSRGLRRSTVRNGQPSSRPSNSRIVKQWCRLPH